MEGIRTFKCTRCKQNFESGDWNNCGGNQARLHVVEAKTYYSTSPGQLIAVEKPQMVIDARSGKSISTPGKVVQFMGGQYMTNIPSEQEVLDTKGYLISSEQYAELNLTPELKAARAQTLAKDALRLKDQAEAELARVQAELAEARAEQARLAAGQDESGPLPDPMTAAKRGPGRPKREPVEVHG